MIKMLRSEVMASFAYRDTPQAPAVLYSDRLARPQWLLKLVIQQKVG